MSVVEERAITVEMTRPPFRSAADVTGRYVGSPAARVTVRDEVRSKESAVADCRRTGNAVSEEPPRDQPVKSIMVRWERGFMDRGQAVAVADGRRGVREVAAGSGEIRNVPFRVKGVSFGSSTVRLIMEAMECAAFQ